MTDLPVGVHIYLLSALGTGLLAHAVLKRYVVAVIVAGAASPLAFVLVCLLHGDAVDAMGVPVVVLFAVIGLSIALFAGLPFLLWRRTRRA